MLKKKLTYAEALLKIQAYCAYQERSHKEVKEKLYGFGLYSNETDQAISELIQNNYLNEERFAIAYASGKFRIKRWGRVKIRLQLKQKGVSDYCIRQALLSISEDEYLSALKELAYKKARAGASELHNLHLKDKAGIAKYLLGRGFENELIWQALGGAD